MQQNRTDTPAEMNSPNSFGTSNRQDQEPLSLFLVDDHLLFRQSLATILADASNFSVVGASGNGSESLHLIGRLKPAVAILDIAMPGLGGFELAPRIRECAPQTEILILSMHDNAHYVHRAFKLGCRGYALKSDSAEELMRAITVVAKGETYLSPGIASEFIDHLLGKAASGSPATLLTPREQETCRLLTQGRTTEQLAADLGISPKTVRVHIANVMKKLSCRSRAELAQRLREMENM